MCTRAAREVQLSARMCGRSQGVIQLANSCKEGGLSRPFTIWLHSYAPPLPRRPGAAKLLLERSEHRRRVSIAGLELGRHAQSHGHSRYGAWSTWPPRERASLQGVKRDEFAEA